MKFTAVKDKTTKGAVRFREVDETDNFVTDHGRGIYLTKDQWKEIDETERIDVTIEPVK